MNDDLYGDDPQEKSYFPTPIIHTDMDLSQYPEKCHKENIPETLVIGDLHANPILLIHILIMYRVLKLHKDPYDDLYNLFSIDQLVIKDVCYQINRVIFIFNFVIMIKSKYVKKIILLGDILGDRGCNDYYMLLLLQILDNEIDYTITFSNHDLEFIYQAEHNFIGCGYNRKKFGLIMTDADHTINDVFVGSFVHSLKTLMELINSKNESWRKDIKNNALNIYHNIYKKHLKVADYCIHPTFPDKIILFYHAPIGLRTLEHITCDMVMYDTSYNVPFKYATPAQLGNTIDNINQKFSYLIHTDKWFDKVFPVDRNEKHIVQLNAFGRICWIRWNKALIDNLKIVYDGMFDPSSDYHVNYDIIVIHGHDCNVSEKLSEHVFTLDHQLGQFMTHIYPDANQGSLPLFLL